MNRIDLTEMCNLSADVCGRELIHFASAIQPHGAIIGLDPETMALLTKSANVDGLAVVSARSHTIRVVGG